LRQGEDERLGACVLAALLEGGEIDPESIRVEARDQVLHLRGSVASARQRALVEETARAAGATDVVNELEVTGEPISGSARRE
jgi:osmotically-inducible protein OsmY